MSEQQSKEQLREQIAALVRQYGALASQPRAFEPGVTVIPPAGKVVGAPEMELMVEASLDAWLTTGRFNDQFEAKLAKLIGVQHLITVNSGSSANLVAFNTLTSPKLGARAIQPGDEVIGVAAGFPTTVNPILQFGAVPVFVDVELGTYNIDVEPAGSGDRPEDQGHHAGPHAGQPVQPGRDHRTVQEVQAVADRRLLRCARLDLQGPDGGHLRRHRHHVVLPGAPHHDGRRRRRVHQ
jgi:CDP-6-deoxy-D-xylo-4-hexulose-3-dehydrase